MYRLFKHPPSNCSSVISKIQAYEWYKGFMCGGDYILGRACPDSSGSDKAFFLNSIVTRYR